MINLDIRALQRTVLVNREPSSPSTAVEFASMRSNGRPPASEAALLDKTRFSHRNAQHHQSFGVNHARLEKGHRGQGHTLYSHSEGMSRCFPLNFTLLRHHRVT